MTHREEPTTPSAHPGLQDRLLAAVDGAPGIGAACTRGLLRGLSWLYGAGVAIDLATYPLGLAQVTHLPAEVIAVGNLSLGGTGKTLAVMRLARELTAAGKRVAILSRGYGRRSHAALVVVSIPKRVLLTPEVAGDEPYLMATSLPGLPVLVGKNRRETGRYAIETFGVDVLLLDDGYQYWRLHKDREIVLLDALQPATRDHLLPRGLFREPWSHLRRAHEVWITHAELADPTRVEQLADRVARHAPRATLRFTEHRPVALRDERCQNLPLQRLQGTSVLALSGIGNPGQFEAMLAAMGAFVEPCRYPDHHRFTDADLASIAAQARDGQLVVTTAKDAMRLPSLTPFPYRVVEVDIVDVPAPEGASPRL